MAQKTPSRKRPCRICGKWFVPDPRVGDRQKPCCADAVQTAMAHREVRRMKQRE